MRGVSRSSRYAGRDAVAACGARFAAVKSTANDDGAARGRPKSRGPGVAVLTSKGTGGSVALVAVEVTYDPERWRKSRPPGRARTKPFQPLRAERRMFPARPWRRHSCAFYLCTRGCGCARASGVPRALTLGVARMGKPQARRAKRSGFRAPPRRHNNRGNGAWLFENGNWNRSEAMRLNTLRTSSPGLTR